MRLTSIFEPVRRPRKAAIGVAHWWTRRLALEITAGALALAIVVAIWPSTDGAHVVGPKIALQAPVAASRVDDPATLQFMEQAALAHVGALRPEREITAPLSPPPVVAMSTKHVVAPRDKSLGLKSATAHAAAAKPAGAVEVAKADPLKSAPVEASAKPARRLPLISAMVDHLPTGRDLMDDVSALRSKLNRLVTW